MIEAPAIRIAPLEAALPDGLRPAVRHRRTARSGCSSCVRDARALAGVTVAAIGPGTARALRERGIEPDVVPERAVAEGLVEALRDVPFRRAVVARAKEGRDVLPDALRARGAEVEVVALYETVAEPLSDATRAAAAGADYAPSRPRRRCASSRRRAARCPGPGSSRSARRRAPSCASTAPSPTSRPTRTRRTASSQRCSRLAGPPATRRAPSSRSCLTTGPATSTWASSTA